MTDAEQGVLPEFVAPMLAKSGDAFDSEEHVFELKWDGIRCLAFLEAGAHRFLSRTRQDMTRKYPELEFPAQVAPGTVLDGELVYLKDGKPDFHALLSREHARSERRIRELARTLPVVFVAFDVLFLRHESVMKRPLSERLDLLREVLAPAEDPRLVRSDGVRGKGLAFFEEVRRIGFEGMVAKRLASAYQPGRRTGDWTKVKPVHTLSCAVVGWLEEAGRLKSLVIAALTEGELRCVGRVGSGLDERTLARLTALLPDRERDAPFVDCGRTRARWLAPGVFCTVTYLERTTTGNLRGPVFQELHLDP